MCLYALVHITTVFMTLCLRVLSTCGGVILWGLYVNSTAVLVTYPCSANAVMYLVHAQEHYVCAQM